MMFRKARGPTPARQNMGSFRRQGFRPEQLASANAPNFAASMGPACECVVPRCAVRTARLRFHGRGSLPGRRNWFPLAWSWGRDVELSYPPPDLRLGAAWWHSLFRPEKRGASAEPYHHHGRSTLERPVNLALPAELWHLDPRRLNTLPRVACELMLAWMRS